MNGLGRIGTYLAIFTEIGLVLLIAVLAGVLAGSWVDRQLGTTPIFLLVGLILGLAAGTFAVYRLMTRFLARWG
ncbi:MAG: hypothetical protein A2X23_13205 [Chloroflexi bacterium GWC2_73_18]|nr:MAG: hypothetical protein A2X23_13205 [Chloroflexi bacterium GWC2_73_18]